KTMGPLVPDIISSNLNYIVALIIGIFFGMILEQAGFSSSKKLVGLFYGYDFTVLRVFFTAGVVAMVGVLMLFHFGLLDINLIYINPTFVWSAIAGGLIMGLGFVLGGFCPGTSVCAAAIGKIDAMIFIGGAFIGVLIFAEGYPLFESLYKAAYLGNPRISDTLGISPNLFAFLLTFIALAAFYAVTLIEKKVNGEEIKFINISKTNAIIAAGGILLLIFSLVFEDRKTGLFRMIQDEKFVSGYPLDEMTVDELAFRLLDKSEQRLQIIDFRDEKAYSEWSLPRSTLFTKENLFEKEPAQFLRYRHVDNLFVAEDEITERKMAILAQKSGFKNIKILKGGLQAFRKEILGFEPIKEPKTIDEQWLNRFKTRAKAEIPELIKKNKPSGPVKKKQKRSLGGC
ncbi:MAG: YeeE/YedE thiosulfate transporter family protein, partial [Deltaproteobacteria bacterium]|nr:YeeE/YedE thiosulfate transporter family protein [Deltaproteobacteria bacterium]